MKWSWKLGEVAGIGIYLHATFVLLVAWVAFRYWVEGRSLAAALAGVVFVLALFACVVLHELGHALTAQRYGVRTRDITLLPIGGMARMERMPDEPMQEFWVALAGPAVNVVIAAALYGGIALTRGVEPLRSLDVTTGSFVDRLLVVNLFLAAFNLLPAFPMDGGRVLRALLATRMAYTDATHVAASLGQAMALLFGFLGLLGNPLLLFIALFVWIGAAQEASMVQMRTALGGIPVSQAMITDFRTLSPEDALARAVELLLAGFQQDFPVVEDGRVVGVLLRSDLPVALAQRGQHARVGEAMRRDFQVVHPSEMLETVFLRLQTCDCRTVPVTRDDHLVGLVTLENIGEFMLIQSALGTKRRRAEAS